MCPSDLALRRVATDAFKCVPIALSISSTLFGLIARTESAICTLFLFVLSHAIVSVVVPVARSARRTRTTCVRLRRRTERISTEATTESLLSPTAAFCARFAADTCQRRLAKVRPCSGLLLLSRAGNERTNEGHTKRYIEESTCALGGSECASMQFAAQVSIKPIDRRRRRRRLK